MCIRDREKAVDKALNMIKVKYTILEPVIDFRKSLDNKVLCLLYTSGTLAGGQSIADSDV